jgi:transposase
VGSQWRDLPPRYGPWQTVNGSFRRWQRDGSWWRILTGLQARADAAGKNLIAMIYLIAGRLDFSPTHAN